MSITHRICSIEGCDKPAQCRGWCDMHYRRWRRTGDPAAAPLRIVGDDETRFWSKVDKGAPSACWLWTSRTSRYGYGEFQVGGAGRHVRAHRFAYELLIGPIPDGLLLHHACENKSCVNPAHLEPVTPGEHMRLHKPWEEIAARTTCGRGHPKDLYGYRDQRGWWKCRECRRLNDHASPSRCLHV